MQPAYYSRSHVTNCDVEEFPFRIKGRSEWVVVFLVAEGLTAACQQGTSASKWVSTRSLAPIDTLFMCIPANESLL